MKKHPILENKLQLKEYLQSRLSAFVKEQGKYKPRDAYDSPSNYQGTYTLQVLDIYLPMIWQGEFVVGVLVDVYDDHKTVCIVTDPKPVPKGVNRLCFSSLDDDLQIAFLQHLLGAYQISSEFDW